MKPLRRRARPLLGTLVEVACDAGDDAIDATFAAVARVHALMSPLETGSDIARFNALPAGRALAIDALTAEVLAAARRLEADSGGIFDVALGSGRWALDGTRLVKLERGVRLDLGGIAKGHAVDRAVAALQACGARAGCVNAGGDLRAFGAIDVPVRLRDEHRGGVRDFGVLRAGALATSRLAGAHVSVAAPLALWADALTKVVALGHGSQPLLDRHAAQAWRH